MAGASDKVENAEIPDKGEDEAPKDVRGAITAALNEVGEKDESVRGRLHSRNEADETDDKPKRERAKASQQDDDKEQKDEPQKKEAKDERITPDEGEEEDKAEKEPKEPVESIDPPPYYKNKGRAVWNKLSADDKKLIVAREEEVSRGFLQVSQRIKGVEEIEKAIAPRIRYIQEYGTTPGVVVDRLFQWMEGINNPRTRLSTFKDLAESFGVDLSQLVSGVQQQSQTEQNQNSNSEPPEWFNEFTGVVQEEIGSIKSNLASQQERALHSYVSNWAKDKPHYETVRELMGQLISGGAIPPKNGLVDLDGAYEAAVKLHPDVAAQVAQEASEKAAKEAADKAKKDAQERITKLNKARAAGSGLKPAAPSLASSSGGQPKNLNGKGNKVSVRDSLRQAIDDLRN